MILNLIPNVALRTYLPDGYLPDIQNNVPESSLERKKTQASAEKKYIHALSAGVGPLSIWLGSQVPLPASGPMPRPLRPSHRRTPHHFVVCKESLRWINFVLNPNPKRRVEVGLSSW
jgi:hypothetical protein